MTISASRTALLVLGMHRSGTSALTGTLNLLGCDLPRDLMTADPQNEKGFFESNEVSALNDELLGAMDLTWFDWQPIEKDFFASPAAETFRDRARRLIKEEFGNSTFFVLKDPRLCRFFPFWREALEKEGCQVLAVCTHRDPLDVAASVEFRGGPMLAKPYGLLLWLRYVLDAEAASRGTLRAFTSYERLIADWRQVAGEVGDRLSLAWPGLEEDRAAEAIGTFLSPALRHFQHDPTEAASHHPLSSWHRTVLEILDRWAGSGEDSTDHPTFDRIAEALDATAATFIPIVEEARSTALDLAQARNTLENVLAQRGVEAEQEGQARVALEAQVAALSTELALSMEMRTRAEGLLIRTRADMEILRSEAAQRMRAELTARLALDAKDNKDNAELAKLERRYAEILASTSWRITAPLRRVVTAVRGR